MKKTALVTVLLLVASYSLAATVDGRWEGTVNGTDGSPSSTVYVLKAKGNVLTGSVIGGGETIPIRDGKIQGQNISFAVDVVSNGQTLTFNYTGVVSPAHIRFKADIMGQQMEIVTKKAK